MGQEYDSGLERKFGLLIAKAAQTRDDSLVKFVKFFKEPTTVSSDTLTGVTVLDVNKHIVTFWNQNNLGLKAKEDLEAKELSRWKYFQFWRHEVTADLMGLYDNVTSPARAPFLVRRAQEKMIRALSEMVDAY